MKNRDGQEIHHFDPKEANSPLKIVEQFAQTKAFGGGKVGKAFEILKTAKENNAKVFLSLAGAMIPGGMRKVLGEMMKGGMIDLLVTTGAMITHDLIEAFGKPHRVDVDFISDKELYDRGIDRVYDAFVDKDGFPNLEDYLQKLITQLYNEQQENNVLHTCSKEIVEFLGSKISDEESIVKIAHDMNIPIFVPAIADSVLGLQIWLKSQFLKIHVDEMKDLTLIQDAFHESPNTLAFIVGGGVPKNYMLQSSLMSPKEYNYGIAITMDRVETGGLSGATLEEAVSWGKLTNEAPKVTIYADATIVLPIIVTAWKEYTSK